MLEYTKQGPLSYSVKRDGKCIAFLECYTKRPPRIVFIHDYHIFLLSEIKEMVEYLENLVKGSPDV